MSTLSNRTLAWVTLAASMLAAPTAFAASTWTFSGSGLTDANGEPLANTTYAGADANLTIKGAYATNGAGNSGYAAAAAWNTSVPNADALYWSSNGLGMCSDPTNLNPTPTNPACTSPNHALDNNGNTEAVLLSFSQSVMLTSIGIGWKSGDADISVFRYTGATAPTITGVGASLASMTSAGWSLVGNYADLAVDTTNPYNLVNGAQSPSGAAGATSVGSSWWLITAYNTSYGGSGLTQGDDYFKVYAVAGTACTSTTPGVCGPGNKTPEPGTLVLAGLAFAGLAYSRRRGGRAA